MTKEEFLAKLKSGLSGIPQVDLEERLNFYSEIIDDRVEEGMTETEAIAAFNPIDDLVAQTISEIPLRKLVKERIKPKRRMSGGEILLLILGFPLWFPLLVAAFVILLSVYVVIWSLDLCLWAADLCLGVCGVGGIVIAGIYLTMGAVLPAAAMLGAGIFAIGLSILSFYGCIWTTKRMVAFTKRIAYAVKRIFIKKEREE